MTMDWWLVLNIIRVVFAVSVLSYASYHDMKTRMVSNTFWVILGLVGVALFQCQIIIDLGFEGIPYLIGTIPITILFMSFLTTTDVVDFENKRVNDSWMLLIV